MGKVYSMAKAVCKKVLSPSVYQALAYAKENGRRKAYALRVLGGG